MKGLLLQFDQMCVGHGREIRQRCFFFLGKSWERFGSEQKKKSRKYMRKGLAAHLLKKEKKEVLWHKKRGGEKILDTLMMCAYTSLTIHI